MITRTKLSKINWKAKTAVLLLSLFIGSSLLMASGPKESRVTRGIFTEKVLLTGNLKAKNSEFLVAPPIQQWQVQIKWMVKEGEYVKPGETVVQIDGSSITSDIDQLELNLRDRSEQRKQRLSNLANQKLELELTEKKAEIEYQKSKIDASIPKGLFADSEYEQHQLDMKKAEEAYKKAQVEKRVSLALLESEIKRFDVDIKDAEAALEKFHKSLENLSLKTQKGGIVVYCIHDWFGRKIQIGDSIPTGSPVVSIPDTSSFNVEAWGSETLINRIQRGQKVEIIPDAYPNKSFWGTVKDVLANSEKISMQGKGHYFNVIISLNKSDATIMKPGMSAKCIVNVQTVRDALLVPIEMVHFDGRDFRIKPQKNKAIKVTAIGFNEFNIALRPGKNEAVKDGMLLEPVMPSDIKDIKE